MIRQVLLVSRSPCLPLCIFPQTAQPRTKGLIANLFRRLLAEGARSAWIYGNLEFVMYEYPGRAPGTKLVVGIVTRIHGASTAHLGDVALLAIRSGDSLVGDLWGFASRPTCFLDTLPMKFRASFAPSGKSLHVNRQTASLSGGGATCVLRSDGTKSFTMNQVN